MNGPAQGQLQLRGSWLSGPAQDGAIASSAAQGSQQNPALPSSPVFNPPASSSPASDSQPANLTPPDAQQRKPLIVLGPSLGTSVQALWAPAVSFLHQECHLLGWDLPGHGIATPYAQPFRIADLAVAVEKLTKQALTQIAPPTSIIFAGVSIAGAVGQQLAVSGNSVFEKFAVICSAARIGEPSSWWDRAVFVEQAGTPSMVEGSAKRWFASGFIQSHPQRATSLLHSLQNADRFSYARCCEALAEFDLREKLPCAKAPILVISGAEDTVCPPEQGAMIAEKVAQGGQHILSGIGHLAPAEAPEETAQLIKEFING